MRHMRHMRNAAFIVMATTIAYGAVARPKASGEFEQTYNCSFEYDQGFFGYCSACSEGGNDCPYFCSDAEDYCAQVCAQYNIGCDGSSGFYVDCHCVIPD
jgi:hypothetical protein